MNNFELSESLYKKIDTSQQNNLFIKMENNYIWIFDSGYNLISHGETDQSSKNDLSENIKYCLHLCYGGSLTIRKLEKEDIFNCIYTIYGSGIPILSSSKYEVVMIDDYKNRLLIPTTYECPTCFFKNGNQNATVPYGLVSQYTSNQVSEYVTKIKQIKELSETITNIVPLSDIISRHDHCGNNLYTIKLSLNELAFLKKDTRSLIVLFQNIDDSEYLNNCLIDSPYVIRADGLIIYEGKYDTNTNIYPIRDNQTFNTSLIKYTDVTIEFYVPINIYVQKNLINLKIIQTVPKYDTKSPTCYGYDLKWNGTILRMISGFVGLTTTPDIKYTGKLSKLGKFNYFKIDNINIDGHASIQSICKDEIDVSSINVLLNCKFKNLTSFSPSYCTIEYNLDNMYYDTCNNMVFTHTNPNIVVKNIAIKNEKTIIPLEYKTIIENNKTQYVINKDKHINMLCNKKSPIQIIFTIDKEPDIINIMDYEADKLFMGIELNCEQYCFSVNFRKKLGQCDQLLVEIETIY
jgi:hypothetical protein